MLEQTNRKQKQTSLESIRFGIVIHWKYSSVAQEFLDAFFTDLRYMPFKPITIETGTFGNEVRKSAQI